MLRPFLKFSIRRRRACSTRPGGLGCCRPRTRRCSAPRCGSITTSRRCCGSACPDRSIPRRRRLASSVCLRAQPTYPISQRSTQRWPRWRRGCAGALCALSANRKLLQFELGDLDARRADVLDAARRARLLPVEITEPQHLAAVGLAGRDLDDLSAIDDDAQAGRLLGDRGRLLTGVERTLPGARPLVVEGFLVGLGPGLRVETRGLGFRERDDDVVERRRTLVGGAGDHLLFGI